MQATRSQSIWRRLEELQVNDEGEIQHLGTNNSVGFMHLQLIHILALSPQVTVYIASVLAKHIQVWNQDSLWYGVRVVQTTLQALFRSIKITGVVVQGFRSSSDLLLTRVIWLSHTDLSGSYCSVWCLLVF